MARTRGFDEVMIVNPSQSPLGDAGAKGTSRASTTTKLTSTSFSTAAATI